MSLAPLGAILIAYLKTVNLDALWKMNPSYFDTLFLGASLSSSLCFEPCHVTQRWRLCRHHKIPHFDEQK